MIRRTTAFGRGIELSPGHMDHAPSEGGQFVPSLKISLPTGPARMPPVAFRLYRELDVRVGEVDDRHQSPSVSNLVLSLRERKSRVPDLPEEFRLEHALRNDSLTGSRRDQVADDRDPAPAPAFQFTDTPAQSWDAGQPSPKRIVECFLENLSLDDRREIDERARRRCDGDSVTP